MHAAVRTDLMRKALEAFEQVRHRLQGKESWSGKARDAVFSAVWADRRNSISYLQRCFAFHEMFKNGVPKTLEKFVLFDNRLDDLVYDAVALTPLHQDNKFRIKEFAAVFEKLSIERQLSTQSSRIEIEL